MRLALRYQLISEFTNYFVLLVRPEGEKAKSHPDLRKVAQMLAAGWHGSGSVAESRRDKTVSFQRQPLYQTVPEVLFDAVLKPARTCIPRGEIERALSAFLDRLNALHSAEGAVSCQVRSIRDLTDADLPREFVNRMQEIVDSGESEELVVVAFLHALAARYEDRLTSPTKRAIDRAFKSILVVHELQGAIDELFNG